MPARPDDYDDMDGGMPSARPGLPVDPARIWSSVRRDWKWIPFAGLVWGVLGVGIAFLAVSHSYKSEAVLLWEPQGHSDQRVLSTQAASLKLPVTLAKVKQRLKLGYPLEVLEKQIEVWYDTNSNLVTIQAGGPTAEQARKLTVNVIDVFLQNQTEIARARASDATRALETDVTAARATLAQARRSYDEFRAQHGVTDIDAELAAAVTRAGELRTEQQRAEADTQALGARVATAGEMLGRTSRTSVLSASSANNAAAMAAQAQTELAQAQARFSADHPMIRNLQAKVQALQAQAKAGTNVSANVQSGANPEYQALQGMLSAARADQQSASILKVSYAEALQQTEQRMAQLTAIQGKARGYLADIKLAEERINGLEVQLAQAKDAVRTPPLEFRVLTPASLPEWPEKSKRRSIVIGMPLGGMFVTLLVLLFRPLRDARIYTAREAAFWGNMPVVSTSAWPRNRDAFFPLIDELGDQGGRSRGFTLVLSASERERVLAEELAYWLGGSTLGNDGRPQPRTDANGHDDAEPVATVVTAPSTASMRAAMDAASAGGGGAAGGASSGHALALLPQTEGASAALAAYRRGGQANMAAVRAGAHAWNGDREGPALRRAARAADRVLIVMSSGTEPVTTLTELRTRLGRDTGIALLVLGVREEYLHLPDRVGEVERFWRTAAGRA